MKFLVNFGIFESKRIKLDEELDNRLKLLTELLWSNRRKYYKTSEIVDKILFKTLDGADGMVQVYVDPHLDDNWASIDTEPKFSRDPMDFVMLVAEPRHFSNKNDLYSVIYHEMIHAVDPTMSTKFSPRYHMDYKWWESGAKYFGHQIEQRAIFGEVLNSIDKALYKKENQSIDLLNELANFFSSQTLSKARLSRKAKSFLNSLGEERDIIFLLVSAKEADEKSYKDFLRSFYRLYDEWKTKISED